MTDSFFENPRPKCCDPFPNHTPGFCGTVDGTYCVKCGRWLEQPFESIPREDRHSFKCPELTCIRDPKYCHCEHTARQHNKTVLLNSFMGKTEDEIEIMINKMMNGPHNCSECDCTNWNPDVEKGYED